MLSVGPRQTLRIYLALLVVCFLSLTAAGQLDDPDPNSPTPILVRAKNSKRVLAVPADTGARAEIVSPSRDAFAPGARIAVFVTGISLMDGEGANAFRVYAEDSRGRKYRFPVVDLYRIKSPSPTYALVFELCDEIGYWDAPGAGDLLLRVSWRGMTSDRSRIGYGVTGGPIKDDQVPYSRLFTYSLNNGLPAKSKGLDEPAYAGYRWSGDRMRFLQQASFGATEPLDQRIRRIGIRTWLAEQFEAPYPSATNAFPDIPLKPSTAPADCDNNQTVPDVPVTCFRDTYTMYPLQAWFFREAYYGDAQLRHRVAWALGQIWVISGVDTQQSRHMIEWYKVLSNNAFGNYRTLMKEMTLNPGMGNYLDMVRSTRTNPNENYARELKQLFTIGLFMLNQDGTLQLDGNGQPIPTYDQVGVNNFTKVLTGWNFCNNGCPNSAPGVVNYIDPIIINAGRTTPGANQHDLTAKTLLAYPGSTTTNIAACTGTCDDSIASINTYATNSLEQTLDNIFYHPNVGPFVSKILIQHLVTSDPTPAYVGRVTAVFNDNGAGVRGDLKSVIRAILIDPEARGDVKTDPNFGKLREPVQLMTNVARTFNVTNAAGTGPSDGVFYSPTNNLMTTMAQTAFYSPTVFNYYSPDYVIPGTTLLGPEFALMTTGTAIARANFANTMVYNRINASGTNVPVGTAFQYGDMQALAAEDLTGGLLLDALNYKMLHGSMSTEMRSTILTAVTSLPTTSTLQRAQQAVYLVATSSQFQIQR